MGVGQQGAPRAPCCPTPNRMTPPPGGQPHPGEGRGEGVARCGGPGWLDASANTCLVPVGAGLKAS